jgi:hypothetical protein
MGLAVKAGLVTRAWLLSLAVEFYSIALDVLSRAESRSLMNKWDGKRMGVWVDDEDEQREGADQSENREMKEETRRG